MKKSEARRQAILDAATDVFHESGFDRASMSDICNRVGYSKATVYGLPRCSAASKATT